MTNTRNRSGKAMWGAVFGALTLLIWLSVRELPKTPDEVAPAPAETKSARVVQTMSTAAPVEVEKTKEPVLLDMDAPQPFEAIVEIPNWGNETVRLEENATFTFEGETHPIRVLCAGKLFAYGLYAGHFFALNGIAMREGTKIHYIGGRFPIYPQLPHELRMTAHELIPICVQL